jgi:SAM-dependent methyltransferase
MGGERWFETFFDDLYIPLFSPFVGEERTRDEVAFIADTLGLPAGGVILDLACGYGRILLPLAERGYRVIGVDRSAVLLARARADAADRGLAAALALADMRHLPLRGAADAVISIFSALGYFDTEAENQAVFDQVALALRPGGRFLLDVANPLAKIRGFSPKDWLETPDGLRVLVERTFDFQNGRIGEVWRIIRPDGGEERRAFRVRQYTLPELCTMLAMAGLAVEAVFGGPRGEPYGFDSPRLIALSRKSDR